MARPFNAQSARKAAQLSHAESADRPLTPKRQAKELQALLMNDARLPDTSPAHRAQIARAWKELQAQLMDMEGIGKPKPVQAKNDSSTRARKSSGPQSPISTPE